MPSNFKNTVEVNVGVSELTVYTCPPSTKTTIIGMNVANITAASITASVRVNDSSSAKQPHLVKDASIVPGGSLVVIGAQQKLVLEPGDQIKVKSSIANGADFVMSYVEIT